MKKFLMAAIAVFMMSGSAMAAENAVVVENNVTTIASENVVDKLINLVKGYTKKINAVKTIDELMQVSEQCYNEMMDFQKKYEKEIMALDGTLTEAQQAAYEKKLEAAMDEFEAAAERITADEIVNMIVAELIDRCKIAAEKPVVKNTVKVTEVNTDAEIDTEAEGDKDSKKRGRFGRK